MIGHMHPCDIEAMTLRGVRYWHRRLHEYLRRQEKARAAQAARQQRQLGRY